MRPSADSPDGVTTSALCETCGGLGRIDCLPDDGTHTHPCDDCQREALDEFNRGVAYAEYSARQTPVTGSAATGAPWKIEHQPRGGKPLVYETVDGERRLVAIIANDQQDEERVLRNAALVTAAPLLLAALKRLHHETNDPASTYDALMAALAIADDALAAATATEAA